MVKEYLTIRETANQLRLTDSVVKEMLKSRIFEVKNSSGSQKIKKTQVDEWLANLNEREIEQLALNRLVCKFSDYFDSKYILLDFQAENRYEAIGEMAKFAKNLKIVKDHRWLYNVVVAREELVSTAIGNGVALLHSRHFHPSKVNKPSILVGKSIKPIEFDSIDNQPVNLFFMLLLHNDAQHLFSLSYISKLLMNPEITDGLKKAKYKKDVLNLVTKKILN